MLFVLVVIFTTIFPFEQYPDYFNLYKRLFSNSIDLNYTLQNLVVKFINYFNDDSSFKISDFTNLTFFLPSFFVCALFVFGGLFLDKFYKTNENTNKNFDFLTTLSFPSILLSITAISAEAFYTIISIYIVSRIRFEKGPLCLSFSSIILLFYCYHLDKGNFVVLSGFLFGYISLILIRNITSLKVVIFFILIISFFIFNYGKEIFIFFGSFYEPEKTILVISAIQDHNIENIGVYDLFIRLCYFWITLTSLNFGDKNLSITHLIFLIFVGIVIIKKLKQINIQSDIKIYISKNHNQILFIWMVLFPILFIYVLPTHAYAKYSLFYIVILLQPFYLIFAKTQIYFFVVIFSFLSIFEKWTLNFF
jgi:hypothetical protein